MEYTLDKIDKDIQILLNKKRTIQAKMASHRADYKNLDIEHHKLCKIRESSLNAAKRIKYKPVIQKWKNLVREFNGCVFDFECAPDQKTPNYLETCKNGYRSTVIRYIRGLRDEHNSQGPELIMEFHKGGHEYQLLFCDSKGLVDTPTYKNLQQLCLVIRTMIDIKKQIKTNRTFTIKKCYKVLCNNKILRKSTENIEKLIPIMALETLMS